MRLSVYLRKMTHRPKYIALCFYTLIFQPYPAIAGPDWQLSGYGTIGASVTSESSSEFRVEMTQFKGVKDDIDFGLRSKLAVQLTAEFDSKFSATGQVLAKRRGDKDLDPEVEWLFASYKPISEFDLRAGRLALPIFMLSDFRSVGFAQPFVEPPGNVYIDASVSRFDGVQLLNRFDLGSGSLQIQTSLGDSSEEILLGAISFLPPIDTDIDEIQAINFVYEWKNWSFRAGKFIADIDFPETILQLDVPSPLPMGPPTVTINRPLSEVLPDFEDDFTGYGIQYDNGTLVTMVEITRRSAKSASTGTRFTDSDVSYALVGWRFGDWLPSAMITDRENNSPLSAITVSNYKTTTLTLRYDLSTNMALKFQYEEVAPDDATWLNTSPAFTAGEDQNVYTISFDFVF